MKKTATLSREAEIEHYKALKKTQKLSRVFAMPELANPSELLTKAEIDFFLQNGFLIKKGRLPADETGVAVKRIWQHLVKAVPTKTGARMTLDDPESCQPAVGNPAAPSPIGTLPRPSAHRTLRADRQTS
jgi:hypothetical protein